MWKNGSTPSSAGISTLSIASICCSCATMLRCTSITPFGSPVVPDEYGRAAISLAGSIATAGGSASTMIDASVGRPGVSSNVMSSMLRFDSAIAAFALSASAFTVMRSFTPPSAS